MQPLFYQNMTLLGKSIQPGFLVKPCSNLEHVHRNTWKILTRKAVSFELKSPCERGARKKCHFMHFTELWLILIYLVKMGVSDGITLPNTYDHVECPSLDQILSNFAQVCTRAPLIPISYLVDVTLGPQAQIRKACGS